MPAASPPAPLHTMGAVRRLTGLSDRQIRYYHQRGLVRPRRSPGGHRLFTAEDVASLLEVRRRLAAGLTVPEIAVQLQALRAAQPGGAGGAAPRGPRAD